MKYVTITGPGKAVKVNSTLEGCCGYIQQWHRPNPAYGVFLVEKIQNFYSLKLFCF